MAQYNLLHSNAKNLCVVDFANKKNWSKNLAPTLNLVTSSLSVQPADGTSSRYPSSSI